MNAAQYSKYLIDRRASLERGLLEFKAKLDRVSDSILESSEYALDCVLLGKMQHSLVVVRSELERLNETQSNCQRCGCHIPIHRQQVLEYTLYCRHCAN